MWINGWKTELLTTASCHYSKLVQGFQSPDSFGLEYYSRCVDSLSKLHTKGYQLNWTFIGGEEDQ